jgi:hypothetical protein
VNAKKECQHLRRTQPREKRARILLSTQYEQKIDRIEKQLSQLADHVAGTGWSAATSSTMSNSCGEQYRVVEGTNPAELKQSRKTTSTGDTPFVEPHLDFSRRLLGRVLRSDADQVARTAKEDQFAGLRDMITPRESAPLTNEELWENAVEQASANAKYCLPPFTAVASLLGSERGRTLSFFSMWMSSIIAEDALMGHCVAVYYSDVYTEYQLILVAALLLWKFADRAASTQISLEREALEESSKMCRVVLETALSRLPLHMPRALETAQALLLGASYAIGVEKPERAWTMTCKASEICQALGYHQLQEDDGRRNCSVQPNTLATFSMIYVLDKGLSLRLGRCSNLQDHDITTFRRQESRSEHGCSNFQQYMTLSISHASLQGKTYEQLYSATGLALQTESRLARAQELIVSLSKLGKDMQTVRERFSREVELTSQDSMLLLADEVTLLSLRTLVLRTLKGSEQSADPMSHQCIDVAREALECHRRCIEAIEPHNLSMLELYINWALLYTPFVPVIVVFSSVLETGDVVDLTKLQLFIGSLRDRSKSHRSLARLCVIFEPLLEMALRFVELRAKSNANIAQVNNVQGKWTVRARAAEGGQPSSGHQLESTTDICLEPISGNWYDATEDFIREDPKLSEWLRDCQETLFTLQQDDLFLTGTNLLQDF